MRHALRDTHAAHVGARDGSAIRAAALQCHLLKLSHDELGVIADTLSDVLMPILVVALSCTCRGLRLALCAIIKLLDTRHSAVIALSRKVTCSASPTGPGRRKSPIKATCLNAIRETSTLYNMDSSLSRKDMAALGMVLRHGRMPQLRKLTLVACGIGDRGLEALLDVTGGTSLRLRTLVLSHNKLTPTAAGLASAIATGVLPMLEELSLQGNPIQSQGATALVMPLRRLRAFKFEIGDCGIRGGDELVAHMVAGLREQGCNDFWLLQRLQLHNPFGKFENELTQRGISTLATALTSGSLPALSVLTLLGVSEITGLLQATVDELSYLAAPRLRVIYKAPLNLSQ